MMPNYFIIKGFFDKLQCSRCSGFTYGSPSKAVSFMQSCNHSFCEKCIKYSPNITDSEKVCIVCRKTSTLVDIPTMIETMCSEELNNQAIRESENNLKNELEKWKIDAEWKVKNREEIEQYYQKCVECGVTDSELNMHLCGNCNTLEFENLEDVKNQIICSTCAIKGHVRNGHQIVECFPYIRSQQFASHSHQLNIQFSEFKNFQDNVLHTATSFNEFSNTLTEQLESLTDIVRRSKNTKIQNEMLSKLYSFFENSKTAAKNTASGLNMHLDNLKEVLAEMQQWNDTHKTDIDVTEEITY